MGTTTPERSERSERSHSKSEKSNDGEKPLLKFVIQRGVKFIISLVLFIFLLLLLIWDMKQTAELSEIIHDDHSDGWEKMNSTLLQRWFTPIDLCMLKIDKLDVDIKQYRQKNCSRLQGGNGVDPLRLFCGIGSSLGKPCTSPLSTKSFFTSHLIGKLGDPGNNILKTVLRRFAEEKRAFVFIGDALSKQNQEALICELMRTDRIIATRGNGSVHIPNATVSEFNVRWKDRSDLSLDIIFMHIAHLGNFHRGHRGRRKLLGRVGNEVVTEGRIQEQADNSSVYAFSQPSMTLQSAEFHMDSLLSQHPEGVVVVANIGVWYNSRETYRKELPYFLRWLSDIGNNKNNLVMFRETAAQHWNHTVNGYFEFSEETMLADSSCVPIADSREDLDWRNRDVKFIIENEKLKHIHIIPFRDITAPLYDMHPDAFGSKDCTRFCYFPQMWQSVWWDMNRISNRSSIAEVNSSANH